jgi:hypothetical protein
MSHTDDCPVGRSQFLTLKSTDAIVVDRKTFKQVFALLHRSVDELNNVRHREIFLKCLDEHLSNPGAYDDSHSFQASLLLDAYSEYVPASLALLSDNLREAFELMRGVGHE